MKPVVETSYTSSEEKLKTIKIVLVGNTKVGKTSLITAFTGTGTHDRGYSAAFEIPYKNTKSKKQEIILGRIFDLRSQRYFPFLHSLFYNKAKAAIIIFDVTRRETFDAIYKWREIIWGHTGTIPLLLCGNKSDLRQTTETDVTIQEALNLAKHLSQDQVVKTPYIEISATKRIIAYYDHNPTEEIIENIYPTIDEFRHPFVNWLLEITNKISI
ncbi:MAG: GTP-binding protein [Candidatus Heimdallarchaeota archaeon]